MPTMDASKLLQLQTSAAYSSKRPQPQPIQDVLDLSPISDSRSGSDASSHGSFAPALQTIRCSRCHRTASFGSKQMVSFGVNSYYCTRCASIVGFGSG
ncbi:uncharacterized protein K452DRAFT_287244 [Aplosporella prunicola CBS 121167]|uniref:Uncharacterized protein n=1 Tax=Aplosporella prunicola CBS 121167 TaxID=1176127 RepID=A0A6A6BF86_9PEZI|nr:uncharacterized protein K452DRAFT_287244 [Aplosporella prunicola CBS 121167]KAF2142043.1 hypothetical protein K452DRAFT_287244 [Aplosporella prunicola CBS 121167]